MSDKSKIVAKICQTQGQFDQAVALLVQCLRQEDDIKEQDKQSGFIQSYSTVDLLKTFWQKKDLYVLKRGEKVISFIVIRKSQQIDKYKDDSLQYGFMKMLGQIKYKGKNINQSKFLLAGPGVVSKQQRFKGISLYYVLLGIHKGYDLVLSGISDSNFASLNSFHTQGLRIVTKVGGDRYILVGELKFIMGKIIAKL